MIKNFYSILPIDFVPFDGVHRMIFVTSWWKDKVCAAVGSNMKLNLMAAWLAERIVHIVLDIVGLILLLTFL